MDRKVILYIATSLDGYSAKPNDDLGFLSMVEQEGQDYGYEAFEDSVDEALLAVKHTTRWFMWVMTSSMLTKMPI